MSRQTNARVTNRDGGELLVQDNQSDAPLLPVASLERLSKFQPDKVEWVFEQTRIEAETRRAEQRRINTFVFIERIAALIFALAIGICGVCGGLYAALKGHDWLGGVVASVTIGTLAVAFLGQRGKR
jgi:hypothetical protein